MLKVNKKAQISPMNIIMSIIIGVAVLVTISFELGVRQQQINEDNKEVNLTNTVFNQTISLANNRIVAGTMEVLNSSCRTDAACTGRNGTLVENAEYTVDLTNGKILFINRTGQWNLTYDNFPPAYASSAISRTILSFIAVFAALAVLAFVARAIFVKR
ncbi:hypothetical protein LCGC14_0651140 [marine sediment metagenome]|uniref:Uncharacterized protein n=1 Tax=marine sediment metagenome TaxID=412755 RepID=A0A0F9QW79_9ZZZZ